MPKGASGRVVVEIDAALKRRLYSILAGQGMTLKDWFIRAAGEHIEQFEQPSLPVQQPPVLKGRRKP